MKKIVFVLMLTLSAGLIVSCGSEDSSEEKEKTEQNADKADSEEGDKDKKSCCKKDGKKCCKHEGKMCDSRSALQEELTDEEKATIASAREKFMEVVGEDHYHMMSNMMCDKGGKCCGKCKDGKKCEHKDGEHEHAEGKKCEHGDSAKCCKHGHHGMMGMMHDMDSTKMKEWHEALMPTIESLMSVAEAHADHFEEVKALHAEMMKGHKEMMEKHHGEDMDEKMKEMHEKMHNPEHKEQMMTVHYLLMNPEKCTAGSCKKSEDKEGSDEE